MSTVAFLRCLPVPLQPAPRLQLSRRRVARPRSPRAAATHGFRFPPPPRPALLPASASGLPALLPAADATATAATITAASERARDARARRWRLVIAASLLHALHATAVYMVPSTLLSPMRHSLSLTVAEATRPLNIYRLVQAALLLPAGLLLDAVGPGVLLRVGMLLAAILAPLLAVASSLQQLMVLQALFAISKLLAGLSCLLVVIAGEFRTPDPSSTDPLHPSFSSNSTAAADKVNEKDSAPADVGLGTASSVLIAGYSLAGFLAPAAIGAFSHSLGWRATTLLINVPFSLIAIPLTLYLLRSRTPKPQSPEADKPFVERLRSAAGDLVAACESWRTGLGNTPQQQQQKKKVKKNRKDASEERLMTPGYALLLACVAAFSFSMHVMFDHFLLFLTEDVGLAFATATRFLSLLNLVSVGAKLTIGPVSDRVCKSLLLVVCGIVGVLASCSIFTVAPLGGGLALTASLPRLAFFVVTYSLAYSCIFSLTTSMLPEFGRGKLGVRSSVNMMTLFLSGSAGSFVAAQTRAQFGSYLPAFASNVGCFAIVALAAGGKYWLSRRAVAGEREREREWDWQGVNGGAGRRGEGRVEASGGGRVTS